MDNGGRIGYDSRMENTTTPAPFVGAPDRNPAAERAARRQADPVEWPDPETGRPSRAGRASWRSGP